MQKQLVHSKTVSTESRRICEKDLTDSLYRFYFLNGQKKECSGVCSEMLQTQVSSF